MKGMPVVSMETIASEILSRNGGSLEEIRKTHARGGRHIQEITWRVALISIAAHKAGWEYKAIGRFLNRNHSTIMYHCGATKHDKNTSNQQET